MSTLITDNETLRRSLPNIDQSLKFAKMKVEIQRAQNRFIKPLIGDALLNVLVVDYTDPGSSSSSSAGDRYTEDEFDALKKKFQDALGHLAFYLYIPKGGVTFAGTSFSKVTDENTAPLNYYEQQDIQQEYLESGLDLLDEAMRSLDENASSWSAWTSSSEYTKFGELFIRRMSQFQKIVNIGYSFRTFDALHPIMVSIEDLNLVTVLGEDLADEIRAAEYSSTTTAIQEAAAELVRKYIAHTAAAEMTRLHTVKVDHDHLVKVESAGENILRKIEASKSL